MKPYVPLAYREAESPYQAAANANIVLSVVVPCFNEQETLGELERRLCKACDDITSNYEIIFVNDGSRDKSGPLIAEMVQRNPRVVCIELSRNFGHQAAVTAGLSFARGQRVMVIDADLQDPPELLSHMWKLMDQSANMVYGKRIHRRGEAWLKIGTAKLFYRLLNRLTDLPIPIDTGDFRLIDRQALNAFLSMPEHYRFVRGMLTWVGLNQVELPYERDERFAGNTKYSFKKMFLFAIDAVTGFSIVPLRLAFFFALASIGLAMLVAIYAIVGWMTTNTVQGWTSLLLMFLLFSSVQLVCISIVGEYVGRTYIQTKQRPLYVVKAVYAHSQPGQFDSPTKNADNP